VADRTFLKRRTEEEIKQVVYWNSSRKKQNHWSSNWTDSILRA